MAGERTKLIVKKREHLGSAETRRLRREGLVPGVLYGRGEPIALAIEERELRRALTGKAGLHSILDVEIDGTGSTHASILKDYQVDKVRGGVTHVDLHEVRLDLNLAQRLREHTALLDAGRVLAADQVHRHRSRDRLIEANLVQVDVRDAAPHFVHLVVLEDRGVGGASAVDLDVEDRVETGGARQRAPELALLDGDRDRLAAPVEDAGDDPLAAEAACLARAEVLALLDDQLCAFSGHSDA